MIRTRGDSTAWLVALTGREACQARVPGHPADGEEEGGVLESGPAGHTHTHRSCPVNGTEEGEAVPCPGEVWAAASRLPPGTRGTAETR